MVVENKNRKSENFFIPCPARSYTIKPVYNFVDFHIKCAGNSNYGGFHFSPQAETS
jgi:hypothetical protein